jgi:DnaJ-class molecular chaperone
LNFDEVAEAYEVLSNSVLRTQYNLIGLTDLERATLTALGFTLELTGTKAC